MELSTVPLIKELERTLEAAIDYFGLTVPADKLMITLQTRGSKSIKGWFARTCWHQNNAEYSEVNICCENLGKGLDSAETLLHEIAHSQNNYEGVKDCNGHQHTKKFKLAAEKLGLIVASAGRDRKYGYGITELGEEAKVFLDHIKFKSELFDLIRKPEIKEIKKAPKLFNFECQECEEIIKSKKENLDATCNDCQVKFLKKENS